MTKVTKRPKCALGLRNPETDSGICIRRCRAQRVSAELQQTDEMINLLDEEGAGVLNQRRFGRYRPRITIGQRLGNFRKILLGSAKKDCIWNGGEPLGRNEEPPAPPIESNW